MPHSYTPQGICPHKITFELEDGVLRDVEFTGGCDGNLKAIRKLVSGRPARQVAELLSGITCDNKPTSCADQLAKAIENALRN